MSDPKNPEYANKHVGDECFKCGGHFVVRQWTGPGGRYLGCSGCPSEEHLHIACNQCGYWVWEKTNEQRQRELDDHSA